jgi:hypothetical protein
MHVGKITKLKTLLDLFPCYWTFKKFCCNENNSTRLGRYEYTIGRWGGKELIVPYLCDVSNLHSKPFKWQVGVWAKGRTMPWSIMQFKN